MSRHDDDLGEAGGFGKFIPAIVLISAVTGFITLAWYAYHAGRQSNKEEDLLVIEAEKTPVKEKPLDPGGMKFPNQDKTIFETFSTNQPQAKVERVLPVPEEPITRGEELESAIEPKQEPAPEKTEAVSKHDMISFNDNSADEDTHPEPVKIEPKKPEPVKEEKKKAVDEKPAAKATAVKTGSVKVQLGAYGSEKEAQENWRKIQTKFPALSGHSPIIVKADVKGKAFYRLRVGLADKGEAKSLCKTLSGKGQACIMASE